MQSLTEIEKKRARWLQYHDQMTAGIPGLLPLYYGMKARVTEKISKQLRILKHTPCTVVGWDLHSADRAVGGSTERMLRYLPHVIYVHFEHVKVKIHPDLAVGVFPLKSVSRSWDVNHQTGAKVKR